MYVLTYQSIDFGVNGFSSHIFVRYIPIEAIFNLVLRFFLMFLIVVIDQLFLFRSATFIEQCYIHVVVN